MVLASTTGDSKRMIMNTAARSPEAVRWARRGILMSEALADPGVGAGQSILMEGSGCRSWIS